jgi:hypothetical protein
MEGFIYEIAKIGFKENNNLLRLCQIDNGNIFLLLLQANFKT